MKRLVDFSRDQPMTGIERAIWWIEYVLRHNDTEHLKSNLAYNLGRSYYEFMDLDLIAVLTGSLVVAALIFKIVFGAIRYK